MTLMDMERVYVLIIIYC